MKMKDNKNWTQCWKEARLHPWRSPVTICLPKDREEHQWHKLSKVNNTAQWLTVSIVANHSSFLPQSKKTSVMWVHSVVAWPIAAALIDRPSEPELLNFNFDRTVTIKMVSLSRVLQALQLAISLLNQVDCCHGNNTEFFTEVARLLSF